MATEINGTTLLQIVDEKLQDADWLASAHKVFELEEAVNSFEYNLANA